MGGKSLKKCEICGVRRVRKCTSGIFLAKFPMEPNRCRLWVKATGNEDLAYLPLFKLNENKFICGDHFPRHMFNKNQNRLKKYAVPTLNLLNPPLSDDILANFPFHESNIEKKGILVNGPASTSKAGGHSDTPQVEKRAHDFKKRKIDISIDSPASTSKQSTCYENTPRVEDQAHANKNPDAIVHGYRNFEMTPRKKRIIKKLQHTQNLLKTLSDSSLDLESLESDFLKDIINQAIKNQTRKRNGKRWDMKTKISCLQIFKRSPRTYRHLQHNIPMPSVRTIQRLLQNLAMEPGISVASLKQLQDKAMTMLPENKLCTLIFDEISLKKRLIYNENTDKVEGFVDYGPGEDRGRRNEIACKALVFMIQGIKKKYKQPLAYYFVKGTISSQHLASLINNIIKILEDASFTVIATVCDQGPTNCGALSQLKKNAHLPPDANYFYVNSCKIYIIFDIPHLFKSIRNNFYEAGTMEMDGKRAKWQHLRDAEDVNQGMLYFHKITPMLLRPKQKMKMKVKYAAKTLSNTFAAILKMIAEKHTGTQYGREVEQTSDIVRDLNQLFDITNGPAHPKDVIKGRRENVSKKTNHLEVWNSYLKKIPTIKFLKNDSRLQLSKVRCIQGFTISIQSLKDIWFDCQKKGFRYLNLRQLNQDSLENFFGIVRQSSPTNRNPTCTHFASALKTILISGLNTAHSRGANCENDMNKLLFTTFCSDTVSGETAPSVSHGDAENDTDEYPTLMLPETEVEEQIETELPKIENQPLVYMSGYLAYRLLKRNNCPTCSDLLQEKVATNNVIYKYISLREWWKDKRSLTYPSIQLCRTTEDAVLCFKSNLHIFHEENVSQMFRTLMMVQINFAWWNCNSHRYMNEIIIGLIVKSLIRRQCQIYNYDSIKAEEINANANKISQASSTAK